MGWLSVSSFVFSCLFTASFAFVVCLVDAVCLKLNAFKAFFPPFLIESCEVC